MKPFAILLVLVLRITAAFADDAAISNVYIHKSGKTNLYVLQLKDGNAYDYMRYTDKRMYHDFGVYSVSHGKITFVSHNRTHGFNSVGGKTFFLNKKGLFKTRMDAWRGKKSVVEFSDDDKYKKSWDFNPLTGKSAADLAAEKQKALDDKSGKTEALRLKEMAAFTKRFYLVEAETYANPYKDMLENNYCGPESCATTVDGKLIPYTGDTTKSNLIANYTTIIHESTHTFNSFGRYLIIPGIEIPVGKTPTFNSSEFKSIVPADASTKIFRYGTYVGDSSIVSSNVSGIYGLMDEFSAYENGTRAAVLSAETALDNGDTALARNFLGQASQNYFAAYEFELFIGWYLHYAKTNHPDMYKSTMANTNFRITYTLIDQEFTTTINRMKLLAVLAKEEKGFPVYNEQMYAAYPKTLLVKEKTYLDAFKVKGVTDTNYTDFIAKSNPTTTVKSRG